jgi:hypothetical protein
MLSEKLELFFLFLVLFYPIIGVKATLIAGAVDSSALAFENAGYYLFFSTTSF